MKLRLLMTDDCNRSCEGCCNKDWDLNALPKAESGVFRDTELVMLTGGEPMLYPYDVLDAIHEIKRASASTKIYIYTADVTHIDTAGTLLSLVDGMTVTLHEQDDVIPFLRFANYLSETGRFVGKSLRVNVFEGVRFNGKIFPEWALKEGVTWIKNCPLPNDEVFMRWR